MKFILTQSTAIKHLVNLFADSSKDSLTMEEAFIMGKRNLDEKEKNKIWFKNQLAYLKQHNFVKPTYIKKDGVDVVRGIELTEQGKIALKRITGQLNTPQYVQETKKQTIGLVTATPQTTFITTLTTQLLQANPDKDIIIDYNSGTISVTNKR